MANWMLAGLCAFADCRRRKERRKVSGRLGIYHGVHYLDSVATVFKRILSAWSYNNFDLGMQFCDVFLD